ncbi:hypothetical protein L6452_28992 [Arctium lappa]|uniref:Uncharacterized protein n=1 Tax=Arctium lappa TaxID=4217 RepID=A0ACB8ZGZ8_ARCLA|nr:hypothetical protein L6452_28992 [Arctium lappa]
MTLVHVVFFFFSIMSFLILLSHFHFLSGSNKYVYGLSGRDFNINTTNSAVNSEAEEVALFHTHRKLLFQGSSCTGRDLSISQSKESTTGIPQYIAVITGLQVSIVPRASPSAAQIVGVSAVSWRRMNGKQSATQ